MIASEKRNDAIDLIKSFAIIGVLLIHVSAGGFTHSVLSLPWNVTLFWASVSRASVPLFFMCSGALLLRPEKPYSLRRILKRNLPHILVALFVWAMIYQIYWLWRTGTLDGPNLFHAFKKVLLFQHEQHLYYLQITILLYLSIPLLRVFTDAATKHQLQYALLLWFALGIAYPTLKGFWPFTLLTGIPTQYLINMTWASLGYCLLGHYITRYPVRYHLLWPLLWAAGLLMILGGTAWFSYWAESLQTRFFEGMSIPVAVMAAGIFGSLCQVHLGPKGKKIARTISSASFCIYLVHLLFLHELSRFGYSAATFSPWFSIPVMTLADFFLSFLFWFFARKVPLVRRWLI